VPVSGRAAGACRSRQSQKSEAGQGFGNCLGVLAQVQLRAIEGTDLEQRIAALEAGQNDPTPEFPPGF
jgi:hypothetical protein